MSSLLERVNTKVGHDAVAQAQWTEKRYIWVTDKKEGYLQGSIKKDDGENFDILFDDGSRRIVNANQTEKMNPPKFDRVEDMAELTHLNEASVIHNLRTRYLSNLIYVISGVIQTYSGLFCVTVNPYKKIAIYTDEILKSYKGKKRAEMAPHVFSVADQAFMDMQNNRENQSILITGESGAGKTENTKKVIQYLAATASTNKALGGLELQILQANPILEAFGNAQTTRNNNSSRFGKFIRIEFGTSCQISGASIDRYLLEKSRVTHQTPKERNYHIFYQLLKGGSPEIKQALLLDGTAADYRFTKNSNKNIDGVDDSIDFRALRESFSIMNFNDADQLGFYRIISAILQFGNVTLESERNDQADLAQSAVPVIEKLCHVLGVPVAEFTRCLLKPQVKAGRDWVTQSKNVEQVYYSIEALSRSMYERMFGNIVEKINKTLYTTTQKQNFIGVLDIAGFEIFEINSYEQLCINYTNERLQQFFNHHMFILEQEEYRRENIDWKFIDFGLDLQPAIDLIEKTNPIGILSLLDEECVMPKATDKTFIDKLNGIWKGKSTKYDCPRFNSGFILQHYAGNVEYSVAGWLDKNKDPLNDNLTKLLAGSSISYISELFADCLGDSEDQPGKPKGITKKGAFRTVGQRHKEGLTSLMAQLYSTSPHFVRCIIPNEEKKAGKIDVVLVLDQLRCNGVLEGLRICRAGFPNRVLFADFKSRYQILAPNILPKGYLEGRQAANLLLEALALDKSQFRVGVSKIFFKAGVLADLENQRDVQLSKVVIVCQAHIRGYLARKRFRRKDEQARAIKIIQKNARIYVTLREWSWWRLYVKIKPLMNVTRNEEEMRAKEALIEEWKIKALKEAEEKAKLEASRFAIETEKKRIEDMLLEEQRAAVDMNEILTRTQQRELDLNDRLKELAAFVEERDLQNHDLSSKLKSTQSQYENLVVKSENDKAILERLDKEKAAKDLRFKQLEEECLAEIDRIQKLEAEKRIIESQLNDLKLNLENASGNQAELAKQKSKLQASLLETEQKLEQEQNEKRALELRRAALDQEISNLKQLVADYQAQKAELESILKKRDAEIITLSELYRTEGIEKDNFDRQRRDLQAKLQNTHEECETQQSEREKLVKQKKILQDELHNMGLLVQNKGTEETKNSEIRKIRDLEIENVKIQLANVEAELGDFRKKAQAATLKVSEELEALRQESSSILRAKVTLEAKLNEALSDLETKESTCTNLDKSKRLAEKEIGELRNRISELELSLTEVRSQKDSADKQVLQLTSKLDESELNSARIDRDKQSIQRTCDQLQEDIEDESHKRQNLETQKKRLATELSELQAKLEEEELAKNNSHKQLVAKSAELDVLREKYTKDVSERTFELEDAKKKVEKELAQISANGEEMSRLISNLEKTKTRLNAEIEDLKLEMDREHTTTKNAERLLKQVEGQLASVNQSLESERKARESSDSNSRKLQSNIDNLNNTIEEKTTQITVIQKSKNDLESELKALINEIGDGGKNIHDLERAKRRLDQRVEELLTQLQDEESTRRRIDEIKMSVEAEFADYRSKAESDLFSKDAHSEETRRVLMKEVNSLGEQLDEAINQKTETQKSKKKLEDQINELSSLAENSAKGQSDLQKIKNKNESMVTDLKSRLEEEERNRRNFEELSSRHEKKANALQSEIERLELQNDSFERSKKQLEKQVTELDTELNYGDESKVSLLALKRKLLDENSKLFSELQDYKEENEDLKASAKPLVSEFSLSGAQRLEYEDRIAKSDEQRRVLLVAARFAAKELDDKSCAFDASEKAKSQLMSELEALGSKCESEMTAKSEEVANRKKISVELKDLQNRFEAEVLKSKDLNEAVTIYKDRLAEHKESGELAHLQSEKLSNNLRAQIKELEESIQSTTGALKIALERALGMDDQNIQLQNKYDDASQDLADLQVFKKKVQDEVAQTTERYRNDITEREALEESARKKYQKELKQLMSDLETEKNSSISLKEIVRDFEIEIESLQTKLDGELRGAATWKREQDKVDNRVIDLNRSLLLANKLSDESQIKTLVLSNQVRDLKFALGESEIQRSLIETSKKSLEQKLHEIDLDYQANLKSRADFMNSSALLSRKATELSELEEDSKIKIEQAEDRSRRAESHVSDVQIELSKERSLNIELEKAKLLLEKAVKEFQNELSDIQLNQAGSRSNNLKELEKQIAMLSTDLDKELEEKSEALKSNRKNERIVRELQFQLSERDKAKTRFEEEQDKADQKIKKMRFQIEEFEASEGALTSAKRRSEREVAEYKEKSLKYERELEKLKNRMDRSIILS